MRVGLLLFFTAIPLLELALLIKVGQWIGFWWTMLILFATAAAGVAVLHRQGFSAMRRMMQSAREGRPPIEPVVDSLFLFFAGTLLVVPGLISDALGCLLLVRPLRHAIARWILSRIFSDGMFHVETRTFGDTTARHRDETGRRSPSDGVVIEGEWERVDQPAKKAPDTASDPRDARRDAGSAPNRRD